MHSIRFRGAGLALLILAVLPAVLSAQQRGRGRTKVVAPPKFSKSVVDVFFEDARQQLVGDRPNFGAAAPAAAPAGGAPAAGGTTEGQPASGGFAWSRLISAETLESEIKTKTTELAADVATPGKFNSAVKKFRNNFSVLATMFGIIAAYDGDVRWKDAAPAMRDAVAKAGFNCKVGTQQSFNEAKARFTDITELIGGGKPSLGQPEEDVDWSKVADLTELMKRIEEANDKHLKPWIGDKGDFDKNKEQFLREAEVLAALAQVIQDPAHGYEDESYLEYSSVLQQGALEMAEAAKAGDFARAQKGSSTAAKACNDCHGDFR